MTDPYECKATEDLIRLALQEDLDGKSDITVESLVKADSQLSIRIIAKADGIICGVPLFGQVCTHFAGEVIIEELAEDGDIVKHGDVILTAQGSAAVILQAERTALNLMQRCSAVATLTKKFVDAVAGTNAKILDTRKTTPGMRALQKYAVLCGGGANHRIGLYDQVLIKENHIALMDCAEGERQAANAVRQCRKKLGAETIIEVEIETLDDLPGVIAAGANIVLLDNMGPELLAKALEIRGDAQVELEASGGITLETIRGAATSGVDRISLGALTHSAGVFDLSLLAD